MKPCPACHRPLIKIWMGRHSIALECVHCNIVYQSGRA